MGLFNGMKDKLGFGSKPEWQDDGYQDGYADDGYQDGYADDGYAGDAYADEEYADNGYDDAGYQGVSASGGSVVSFDAYNPANFEHVTLNSQTSPRVASSYDDLGSSASGGGYSDRSSSYARNIGTSSARRSDYASRPASSEAASWSNPSDPSFLDNKTPSYSRDVHDDLSSLGSDFIAMHGDPATHLEVVRPGAYSDVEKIANAAKAGKSVVLAVGDTKPALAKRILDFSFGVASALNLNVDKAAERIFVISKGSKMLSDDEREYLKKQGVL